MDAQSDFVDRIFLTTKPARETMASQFDDRMTRGEMPRWKRDS